MSRTIDERIVEMQFNNEQFERNVHQSIGTLDKLKQALNFSTGKNGFDELNSSARRFDMSGVANAVDTVSSRFSALEVIGITALANITNQAVNAGKRMLSSLTIAPISQGFQEYELKMGSVQTIIASTGEKLEVVNKYLEDLNTYSDKTIYSFKDMTSNIGKFTNAGVKLKDAVAAIKGVSNVAAVSGANAQEASRAMYNFSQALSSGAVKLIDWKSIENANMATVEFKDTLLQTALALGTVEKEADGYRTTTTDLQGKVSDVFTTTKGFNESLANQWMTTDVLTQALEIYATDIRDLTDEEKKEYEAKLRSLHFSDEQIKKFEELGIKAADAATEVKTFSMLIDTLREAVGSGWAQTWEILFGDFEEAKKLWTEINDVVGGFIDRSSDARNELLKTWKTDYQGREKLVQGLTNIFHIFQNVLKPFADAFATLFPPITAKNLSDLTDKFVSFTEKVKIATENFPMNIFGNGEAKEVTDNLDKVVEKTEDVGGKAKDTAESISKSIEEIREAVRATIRGDYGNGIPGDREDALKKAGFDPHQVQDYVNKVHELGNGTWDLSDEIMAAAEKSLGYTNEAAEEASKVTETVEEKVSDVVQNGNFLTSIIITIGNGIKNIFGSAVSIVTSFANAFGEVHSEVTVTRKTVLDFIKSLDVFGDKLKIDNTILKKIHNTGKEFFTILKTLAALVAKFTMENMPAFLNIANSIIQTVGKVVFGFVSLVTSVAKAIVTSEAFGKVFDGLGFVIKKLSVVFEAIGKAVDYFGEKLRDAKKYMSDYMKEHGTVEKMMSLLGKAFDKVSSNIVNFGKNLGNKLGIKTFDDFKAKVDGLISSLSKNFLIPGFENFVSTIDKLVNGEMKVPSISEFFGDIGEAIKTFLENKPAFKDFEDTTGILQSGIDGFNRLAEGLKSGTTTILDTIKAFFEGVVDGITSNLNKIDWVGVAAVAGQIGALVVIFEAIITVSKVAKAAIGLVESVSGIAEEVQGFVARGNELLDKFLGKKKTWTDKIKDVGKTLLIFAVSIYLVAQALTQLSAIKKEDLIKGGIALGAIVLALVGMEIALSKFGKGIEVGTALSIIMFAVAIKLLVTALTDMISILQKFEGNGTLIQDAFMDLIILMGSLVGVVAALSYIQKKLGGPGSWRGMITVIGFVIALKLLVGVLRDIAKLSIGKNAGEVLASIGKLILAILALAALTDLASNASLSSGFGMIALVIGLKLLVMTLDDIASIDMSKILGNIGAFIFIAVTLLALAFILEAAGDNAAKAGIGILAIAIAIKLLVGVIKTIGEMEMSTAIKGVIGLGVLMALIIIMLGTMAAASEYAIRAGVAILLIAIAINLLVIPVFLLGSMKPQTAVMGVLALIPLMVLIGALMVTTYLAGEHAIKAGVAILLITLALNGLVYAVWAMGNIEPSKLFKAVLAIGILGWIIGALMAVSSFTKESSWMSIVAIAGGLTALALSLVLLASVPMGNLKAAVASITIIGVIMGALMVLSKFTNAASMATVLLIGLIISALALGMVGIAHMLQDVDADSMMKQFAAIALLVVSLGAVLTVLSAIQVNPATAINVGLALGAITLIIGGIVALIASIPALDDGTVDKGIERLSNFGRLIGSFFKGFIDAFKETQDPADTGEKVKTFGEKISELVTSVLGAADQLNGKESSLEALKNLVGVIATFATAELIDSVAKFLGSKTDFTEIGTQLSALAGAVVTFCEDLANKKIDPETASKAVEIMRNIAEIYGMPELKSGGFVQKILGESIGLDKLGAQLTTMAVGLYGFVTAVNGMKFNDEAIGKAKELIKFFAEIYGMSELKSGGFVQAIIGESIGLDKLGSQLLALAVGLYSFLKFVNPLKFNDEAISKSKKLLKFFAQLYGMDDLKSGGFLQAILGESIGLYKLGTQLTALATGVSDYVNNIGEAVFDDDNLKKSENLLHILTGIASKEIPTSGGLLGAIFGGKDLGNFGKQLPKLADGIVKYVQKLNEGGLTEEDVKQSVRLTNMLKNLAKTVEDLNDGSKLTTYGAAVSAFGEYIKAFVADYLATQTSLESVDVPTFKAKTLSMVNAYSEFLFMLSLLPTDVTVDFSGLMSSLVEGISVIGDLSEDMIGSLSDSVNTARGMLTESLGEFGEMITKSYEGFAMSATTGGAAIANNLRDGFDSGAGSFTTSVGTAMSDAKAKLTGEEVTTAWTTAGENLGSAIASGVNNKTEDVKSAGTNVGNSGAGGVNTTKEMWVSAGENISSGLAQGIRNGKSGVITAAISVAVSAYTAAKNALDINSPSKLFAKLGEGIDEGFVKGMEDKKGVVTGESRSLVKNMINASQDALNNFADLLNGDIIDDPTITPVLDLSEIQNGANRLYSMMDEADRLSFSGNVDLANAASLSVSRDQQRKRESDNQMMGSLIDAINGLAGLIGNTGNVYNVNGVTYDDGSNVSTAVRSLIRAAKIEGRA